MCVFTITCVLIKKFPFVHLLFEREEMSEKQNVFIFDIATNNIYIYANIKYFSNKKAYNLSYL